MRRRVMDWLFPDLPEIRQLLAQIEANTHPKATTVIFDHIKKEVRKEVGPR